MDVLLLLLNYYAFKFWICRGRHLNSFYAPLPDSKLHFLRFIAQSGKKGQYLDRCFLGGVGTTQSVQGHIIWNEKWQKKGKNRQDILFWSTLLCVIGNFWLSMQAKIFSNTFMYGFQPLPEILTRYLFWTRYLF